MSENLVNIAIPREVENLQLPDPTLLFFYQNLEKRIFWLDEEVSDYTLDLIKYIIKWNEEDDALEPEQRQPIKIFFFSPGGDLDVNNALIDTIQLSVTPVWGINMGRSYSAAAYIFLSCHKRYTLPSAQLLLHQGSGAFQGTYQEIFPQVLTYQGQVENLATFVSSRTKYTEDEVAENITSDWYISVQEGLEKGVYDEVVNDISLLFKGAS